MTTLEDVLASHELRYDEWAIADTDTWLCLCGWVPDMESVDFSAHATRTVDLAVDRLHAAHVAAVIREHWHIVEKVEPKEYVTGTRKVRELEFGDLDTGCIVTYDSDGADLAPYFDPGDDDAWSTAQARVFAACLLSAADVAESQP